MTKPPIGGVKVKLKDGTVSKYIGNQGSQLILVTNPCDAAEFQHAGTSNQYVLHFDESTTTHYLSIAATGVCFDPSRAIVWEVTGTGADSRVQNKADPMQKLIVVNGILTVDRTGTEASIEPGQSDHGDRSEPRPDRDQRSQP